MGLTQHHADIHSWDVEAACAYARGKSADDAHNIMDGWFDLHSLNGIDGGFDVSYIIDPEDGLFLGAIIHHEWSGSNHIWTDTRTGRTYCEDKDGIAYTETDCDEMNTFLQDAYINHF